MSPSTKKSGALFAAALLTSSVTSTQAGEEIAQPTGSTSIAAKAPESNPLSFLGGAVVFDFQDRLRWEYRDNNFDFNDANDAVTDDNWFLQRFRIGLQLKPTEWLRIYAQAQDVREFDSDRADFPGVLGAEGDDPFDLREGYVEIGNPKAFPLTLKVGRQMLSYGDERLIGSFDWNHLTRTFDAAKLRWAVKSWWLDAFVSSVVVPERGSYNQSDLFNGNENGRSQSFSGLYFGTSALSFQSTEIYALHLHENTNSRYQPTALGDTSFVTLGMRLRSKPGAFAPAPEVAEPDGKSISDGKSAPAPVAKKRPVGLDYTVEGAFQTGEVRGRDLTAFAVHADVGYTFDTSWFPRVAVGYNYGSGDSDPQDTDIETFQNLFPTNHKFYGQLDAFSWQNMHNIELNLKVAPIRSVTLRADFHAFFLATTDDSWYRANGTATVRPLTPLARQASSYAGAEIDVLAAWAVSKNLSVEAGFSHLFAGDYLADTGASDDANFAYVQATINF